MATKLGLIGLKHMGSEHYTNCVEMAAKGHIELSALCDNDPKALELPHVERDIKQIDRSLENCSWFDAWSRLRLLHEKMLQTSAHSPALYDNYQSMLQSERLDGVIISTPNHLHRKMTVYALSKDINVLCEKPLATNVEDCDAMIEAENRSKAFLQVGFAMRYRKLMKFIKKLIDEKRIGEVKKIWCQEFRDDWNPQGTRFTDKNGTPTNWRHLEKESGGSILEKLCHDFDLFAWWTGSRPHRVLAIGGKAVHKNRENIDHADILVECESGVTLNVSLCMFAPHKRFKGRYIGVIGDKGIIDFDNKLGECYVYHSCGEIEHLTSIEEETRAGFHPGNASSIELRAFVDNIENNTPPFAGSSIGRDSVAVCIAAQQSIYEGRMVEL